MNETTKALAQLIGMVRYYEHQELTYKLGP